MEHPVIEFSRLWNAFCPTGEGGGVDPSCSPGGGGRDASSSSASSGGRSPLPDVVKQNIEKDGLLGPLAGVREQVLKQRGAPAEGIKEMDSLFGRHRWGGEDQAKADDTIRKNIHEDTPLGKALRTQIALEEDILEHYEKTRPEALARDVERSKKDMKDAWKYGTGNSDAYDSWEEQWEVEQSYKFKDEPVRFYRKGGLDKDVLPTSLKSSGAQSVTVVGTAHQPHFEPTSSWSSADLRAAGYRVLGGLGYIQMGYSGEEEVTWVKYDPSRVWNSFCPTGEGGGVDPSCSPGGGGRGDDAKLAEAKAAKEERLKERVRKEVAESTKEIGFSTKPLHPQSGPVDRNDHQGIERRMTRAERVDFFRYINGRRAAWIEMMSEDMETPSPDSSDVLREAGIDLSESSRFAEAVAEHTETPEDEEELVSVIRDWEHAVQVDPTVSDFERLRDSLTSVTLPPREDGTEPSTGGLEEALDQIVDDIQRRYDEAEQELRDEIRREQEKQLDSDYEDSDEYMEDTREYLEQFYDDNPDRFAGQEGTEKTWFPHGSGSSMKFTTSSGGRYSIDVFPQKVPPGPGDEASGAPSLTVDEVQFSDQDGQFSVTGAGGAHEVFSNVVAGVAAYAMKNEPAGMSFSAYGESRQRLYDKLVKTISHALPGYAAIKVDMGSGQHSTRYYVVAKREHMDQLKEWMRVRKGVTPEVLVNRLVVNAADLDLWDRSALVGGVWVPFAEAVDNAFCPTGEGGGQDNSCSPGGGGSGDDEPEYDSDITERLAATAEAKMEFEDAFDDLKVLDEELYYGDEHYLRLNKDEIDDLRGKMEQADGYIKAEDFPEAARMHMEVAATLLKQRDRVLGMRGQLLRRSNPNMVVADDMEKADGIYDAQAGWHKRIAGEIHPDYKPTPTRPSLRNEWIPFAAAF